MPSTLNTLALAHRFLEEQVKPGAFCIDATAGRGRDTAFLCSLGGPGGRVLAFDIQEAAVAQTRDLLANSAAKLEKKHVDMICANNLKVAGAGFGTDTNVITLITRSGVEELPLLSKEEAAGRILDRALALL